MQICEEANFLRVAAATAILTIVGFSTVVAAGAQAKPSTAPAAAPPVQLQPYTASDRSASAGVPSGWTVKNAVGGAINMSGPQGEAINLGDIFIAHNGTFQLGQRGSAPAVITMPSTAKLTDKLIMFLQQQEALSGMPALQFKYLYAAPLQVPAAMGQCGIFVVAGTGTGNPMDAMGIFCSLPPDAAQLSKLVILMGSAPPTVAAKTVPTVKAVYNSYKIAPGWMQKMFAPYTLPASGASAAGSGGAAETQMYLNAMAANQRVIDQGFTCANANILGNGSNRETPRECGGWAPDF